MVPTQTVIRQFIPIVDTVANREALGLPSEWPEVAWRELNFTRQFPSGQVPATRALELKREADILSNVAQNQLRRGVAPTDIRVRLNDAQRAGLKQGLETIAPGLGRTERPDLPTL